MGLGLWGPWPTVGREGQGKAPGEGGESRTQRLCQGNRNLFPFSSF